MPRFSVSVLFAILLLSLVVPGPGTARDIKNPAPDPADTIVTLMFTNDVESAYDPIPAFWLEGMDNIGGIAEMTTLIKSIRAREPNPFLFDAGDIFTGALAKQTRGALAFELMMSMDYDAMAIGNHEFEYGPKILAWEKNRASFPVLAANMFYRGTDHPFAQAYSIIERNGIRIGVIGIMGRDAVSAIIPSNIAAIDVRPEAEAVQRAVDAIRDDVDLVVLLTHEGKTAPMQTDAESDPRLQRDIDADINLAGAVHGVDVLFAGHADAGTPKPVVQPDTGTLIMQTYGQATHLGYLQLVLDKNTGTIKSYDGKLIPVDGARYKPDPAILAKLAHYRGRYPELYKIISRSDRFMARRYIEESDVGNVFADILRQSAGTDIAFIHAGSLRKDIPEGNLARVDILDVYPFVDDVLEVGLSGSQIREILEQSLSFERGLLQVSGITTRYDWSKPIGHRLLSVKFGNKEINADRVYTVAAPTFLVEGGDLYETFKGSKILKNHGKVSDVLIDYFLETPLIGAPARGRQLDLTPKDQGQSEGL